MTDRLPIDDSGGGHDLTDLQRGGGLALWRQIAEALTREIAQRAVRPDERLPTEAELAARFQVNRHTVRRAIADLEARGLVRVEQGRGMFAQPAVVDYALGRRTRFRENLERQNRIATGEPLEAREVDADATMAKALGVRRGTRLIVLEQLGRADGVPISVAAHHFPAKRFRGLERLWRNSGSITKALEGLGVTDYVRRSTRITARLPDARERALLQLPRTQPLLITEAVNVDQDGRAIEYGVARLASDRVQLVVES